MTKPELGTKRLCANCSARYYDLNKTPITCPKCGTPFEVVPVLSVTTRPRPDQRAAARKAEVETDQAKGAEFISLEDADAEAQGTRARATAEDTEAPEDAETEETVEDDAETPFIEVEEEEDTDVSEIIGGDVEETKRRPE
jgi:uncharacterized protein (TIGR02300 family)